MIRFLFESTPGIQILALIALLIFFALFCVTVIWAIRADSSYVNYLKHLPLDIDNQDGDNTHDKNE